MVSGNRLRERVGNVVRRMHNFEIDISRVGIRVHVCAVAQHRMERQKGERERETEVLHCLTRMDTPASV